MTRNRAGRRGLRHLIEAGQKAKAVHAVHEADKQIAVAREAEALFEVIKGYAARITELQPEEVQTFFDTYVELEALIKKHDLPMDLMPSAQVFNDA